MSETTERHPITFKRIVHRIEGMEAVPVTRAVEYRVSDEGPLTMDVYHPAASDREGPVPMVVIVNGYPETGVPSPLGCAFKDMEWTISLGQLIAASGMAAIAYTTREPVADAERVLDDVARHATALRIDPARVGLWAVSGHVPVALALLMRRGRHTITAAVLSNGFTLDATGSAVADAARVHGFVNASAGTSIDDLPSDVPLFLVRSGRDEFPGLNDMLDRFVSDAVARNLPVTLVNHATAGHAFELNDDSDTSRHVIGQMLAFMRAHLRASRRTGPPTPDYS